MVTRGKYCDFRQTKIDHSVNCCLISFHIKVVFV